ncbi:hypothetical protein [Anaerotignum sp.]|uniref:hypothetical protein n=1 Tax=Anaerotignum sp. TaxID=2039241 RepID=UPI00289FA4E1|nr:hypothetical protein [Anaerotignum sp.]
MEESKFSKLLADIPSVDIVVTMGCNVQCPTLACKHREDWGLDYETFIETIALIETKILNLKQRILNGKI